MLKSYLKLLGNRFIAGIALVTLAYTVNVVSVTLFHYDLSTTSTISEVR